jgi:hypothetical protein
MRDSVWLAAGGVGTPFLERWDGTAWQLLPRPVKSTINEITGVAAVGDHEAWIAGKKYVHGGGLFFEHYICR